jgi:gliding motility-associated-like protein
LLTADASGIDVRCFGESSGSATVVANGGTVDYTYAWNTSPVQNTPTAVGLIAVTSIITVTDANGCTASDSILLTEPLPIFVDATPDSSAIKFGQTVELNTTFQNTVSPTPLFSWEPTAGLSCTDCPNPIASPTLTTAYNVTLIDSNGCIANDIVLVLVDLDKILYVPNAFTPDADGINDVFNIYTLGAKNILFRVFNRWGEKVFETTVLGQGWNGEYMGKLMTPGVFVYYVEVTYLDNDVKVAKGSVTLIR